MSQADRTQDEGATHTPGPWKVYTTRHPHAHGEHIETRIGTAWDHAQLKGPVPICNVAIGIGVKDGPPIHFCHINPADAALMAAAPEMLEALREILAINDEPQGAFNKRGGTRRGLSIVAAKAAIARATGKA